MRRIRWVRWQIPFKPETDTESVDVYATGISVKEVRITRGDLALLLKETLQAGLLAEQMEREVSRGHTKIQV